MSRYGGREPTWSDEELIEAVRDSRSWSGVYRALNLKSAAESVRNRATALELSTAHFTGRAWMLGKVSSRRTPLVLILVEHSGWNSDSVRRRMLAEGVKRAECEECELTEWLGQPIPLTLHHINGVHDDHRLKNLQILCYNCHALTPNWAGRGKKQHTAA